ncbi:MAG: hypothetical protein ACRCV9_18105 [Burkholderiaceae bacterium]
MPGPGGPRGGPGGPGPGPVAVVPAVVGAAVVTGAVASSASAAAHAATRDEVVYAQAQAPTLYFYPERGQPENVQDRDRYECYQWAVRQTGTDPGMTPVRVTAPAAQVADGRGVVAGAVTGAVVGGVIDAGSRGHGGGVVLGAVLGAVAGGVAQQTRIERTEQIRQAQAERVADQRSSNFGRAMSACMSARSYAVR